MNDNYIKDKTFYFLVIILSILFIYQITTISSMVTYFPLEGFSDGTSYMGNLFLLAKYGYHGFAPNWHNGFLVLKHYAPGWFFFTLPIYWITNSIEISTFVSMILCYILSLVFFIILGKKFKMSLVKSITFFLMFYMSPTAFSNFFVLGRLTDLFSFTIFILGFILIYKKRDLNSKWIISFIFIYALLSLNQSSVLILFSFLVLGLLLIIKWKEKIILLFSILFSLLLTSFWWIPFLDDDGTILAGFKGIGVDNFISYGSIISIIFLISFFFYWKDKNKNKYDLLFYLPSLVLVVLYVTRLVSFIPILNKVWPNSYNLFFTFLAIFFILNTRFNPVIKKIVNFAIYLIPILTITLLFIYPVNSYKYDKSSSEILSIFDYVDERLLIVSDINGTISERSLIVYGTIYHNITTPDGWISFSVSQELYDYVRYTKEIIQRGECEEIKNNLGMLKIEQVIAFPDSCKNLLNCGYTKYIKKENVCLVYIN